MDGCHIVYETTRQCFSSQFTHVRLHPATMQRIEFLVCTCKKVQTEQPSMRNGAIHIYVQFSHLSKLQSTSKKGPHKRIYVHTQRCRSATQHHLSACLPGNHARMCATLSYPSRVPTCIQNVGAASLNLISGSVRHCTRPFVLRSNGSV